MRDLVPDRLYSMSFPAARIFFFSPLVLVPE